MLILNAMKLKAITPGLLLDTFMYVTEFQSSTMIQSTEGTDEALCDKYLKKKYLYFQSRKY